MLKRKILTATLAMTLALGSATLVSCGNGGTDDGKVSDTDTSNMMTEAPTETVTELETGTENENGSGTTVTETESITEEATTDQGITDSHARNRTIMPRMGK